MLNVQWKVVRAMKHEGVTGLHGRDPMHCEMSAILTGRDVESSPLEDNVRGQSHRCRETVWDGQSGVALVGYIFPGQSQFIPSVLV